MGTHEKNKKKKNANIFGKKIKHLPKSPDKELRIPYSHSLINLIMK